MEHFDCLRIVLRQNTSVDVINNIQRGQSFVRVDGIVEKMVNWGFDILTTIANTINSILKIMSKFMLKEMAQAWSKSS